MEPSKTALETKREAVAKSKGRQGEKSVPKQSKVAQGAKAVPDKSEVAQGAEAVPEKSEVVQGAEAVCREGSRSGQWGRCGRRGRGTNNRRRCRSV